ncbi:transferase [Macrophomina phaseolina]|uniref:Transferase n=1 Tax=Macrophomina phaseolina TaxID=35725 RepID=A0ABQ8FW45_9PEZI|nr:transferase [Macrophomina phaseolina]
MSAQPIVTTSTHTVRSANHASLSQPGPSNSLGPLDQLVFPTVPVAVVFVYRAPDRGSEIIPLDRLKSATSVLLDYYPHAAGRLHVRDRNGVREISRLNTGVNIYEARCVSPLSSTPSASGRIQLSDLPDGGNALLAPFEPSFEAICRDPILTIQHTRFACGSVALGVRALHTVFDADGFFRLMRDLAEVYRTGTLAKPPHIRPYLAELLEDMTEEDRHAALQFNPPLHSARAEDIIRDLATNPSTDAPPPPPATGRVLRFSSSALSALKAQATEPEGNSWVSTFDALSAHLWQRIYRARTRLLLQEGRSPLGLSRDFLTSVNYRARLGVPPTSPFNCIMTPYTSLSHEALTTAPLRRIATTIHRLTRSVTPQEAEKTARWIAAQPDVRRITWGFDARSGSTMISAWNKFDMYASTAFDALPPALVAPPFTPISLVDGLGYLMPTGGEDGGGDQLDLYLALSAPVWDILETDPEWRRFCSG